jgi:hypothetical protein
MRTTTTAALAAGLLLTLTACSSDKDDKPTGEPTATVSAHTPATEEKPADDGKADDGKADLEKAVHAYSDAYFTTDTATAYAMLSKRCQAGVTADEYGQSIKATTQKFGTKHKVKTVTVDQMSGDMARVSYTYDVPLLSQKAQSWTREDAAWRWDAC